jgi:MSHA biogenesis protein MshP
MTPRARSSGAALMTAIFLIVVLAGLGLAMSNLSNVAHDTTSKANLSAKVYYGAKAGLEWGIQQAIAASSCAGGSPALGGALSDVSLTVTCTEQKQGAASAQSVFYIVSIATTGSVGSLNYAERRVEAAISNIP